MASTVRTLRWIGVLAAVAMLSAVAFAAEQQNTPPRSAAPRDAQRGNLRQQGNPQRVTANKLATDGATAHNNDQTIADWLAIGNQAEIAISQIAESKAEHKDVRKFAEMMVKEHTQLQQQLEKFGASPVRLGEQRERREPSNARPAAVTAPQAQPRAQAQPQAQGQFVADHHAGLNFLEAQREIAERCVATAQKELNYKKGTERDECFVGMQIAAHQHMIDTQKVLREHASPELQGVIDKALETSESHLDHAKHLIRSLVGDKQRDSDKSREDTSDK
jgi:predicted outer membrane protein